MKYQIMSILRKPWVLPAGVGVVSFGGGLAAGYFLGKRQVEEVVEVVEETQLTINFEEGAYDSVGKKLTDTPEKVSEISEEKILVSPSFAGMTKGSASEVMKMHPAYSEYAGVTLEPEDLEGEEEEAQPNVVSIFPANSDDDWDFDKEVMLRTPDAPYIIHKDEFFGDEMGWDTQQTLTWYEGDKILCNEQDIPIHKPDNLVGELKFGHGSGDPNVVYIRNESLQAEYEVLRDRGSYEIDVLGGQVEKQLQEDDLKHSRQPTRFRME